MSIIREKSGSNEPEISISALDRLRPLIVECPIRIDWLASQFRQGERRSKNKGGTGREYCDFREYRPGDDVRRINWKLYARRPHRPMVTLFEEERTANIAVIVDVSVSMNMLSVSLSKRELAAILTASILKSASRTSDYAQFTAYDEGGIIRHIDKRASRRLTRLAPTIVLDEEPKEPREPNPGGGLCEALRKLKPQKSLVFIISDFIGLSEEALEALETAGSRHEVVCMAINDLRERELPNANLLPFLPLPGLFTVVDAEGKQCTIVTTKRARNKHRDRFEQRQYQLFQALENAGCKHTVMQTDDNPDLRRRKLASIFRGNRASLNLE